METICRPTDYKDIFKNALEKADLNTDDPRGREGTPEEMGAFRFGENSTRGAQWRCRRDREGTPEREKASSEGEKMVAADALYIRDWKTT